MVVQHKTHSEVYRGLYFAAGALDEKRAKDLRRWYSAHLMLEPAGQEVLAVGTDANRLHAVLIQADRLPATLLKEERSFYTVKERKGELELNEYTPDGTAYPDLSKIFDVDDVRSSGLEGGYWLSLMRDKEAFTATPGEAVFHLARCNIFIEHSFVEDALFRMAFDQDSFKLYQKDSVQRFCEAYKEDEVHAAYLGRAENELRSLCTGPVAFKPGQLDAHNAVKGALAVVMPKALPEWEMAHPLMQDFEGMVKRFTGMGLKAKDVREVLETSYVWI